MESLISQVNISNKSKTPAQCSPLFFCRCATAFRKKTKAWLLPNGAKALKLMRRNEGETPRTTLSSRIQAFPVDTHHRPRRRNPLLAVFFWGGQICARLNVIPQETQSFNFSPTRFPRRVRMKRTKWGTVHKSCQTVTEETDLLNKFYVLCFFHLSTESYTFHSASQTPI